MENYFQEKLNPHYLEKAIKNICFKKLTFPYVLLLPVIKGEKAELHTAANMILTICKN